MLFTDFIFCHNTQLHLNNHQCGKKCLYNPNLLIICLKYALKLSVNISTIKKKSDLFIDFCHRINTIGNLQHFIPYRRLFLAFILYINKTELQDVNSEDKKIVRYSLACSFYLIFLNSQCISQ